MLALHLKLAALLPSDLMNNHELVFDPGFAPIDPHKTPAQLITAEMPHGALPGIGAIFCNNNKMKTIHPKSSFAVFGKKSGTRLPQIHQRQPGGAVGAGPGMVKVEPFCREDTPHPAVDGP